MPMTPSALAVKDVRAILPRPGTRCQIRNEAVHYTRKGNKAKMRISIVLTGCFILSATTTPSTAMTLASRGTTDVVIKALGRDSSSADNDSHQPRPTSTAKRKGVTP